jgi:hypothetical protein
MNQNPEGQSPVTLVGAQADLLLQRLLELERRVALQEWWMLGRSLPEAQTLAEVASLLAVARAELDQLLVQFCGRAPTESPSGAEGSVVSAAANTPTQQRMLAAQLLQMLVVALPPTITFAQQLAPYAQRCGMPAGVVETLGIVTDRLAEAQEALQAPSS